MRRQAKVSQDEVFEKLAVPHALRVMVVPAVISQLIVLIYNMADTFYVGQTNNPYMVGNFADPASVQHQSVSGRTGGSGRRRPDFPSAGREPGRGSQEGQRIFPVSGNPHRGVVFPGNGRFHEACAGISGGRRAYISLCQSVCLLRDRGGRRAHGAVQCAVQSDPQRGPFPGSGDGVL